MVAPLPLENLKQVCHRAIFLAHYMTDIHTVSDNLNFISYTDDTTLSCPMCSFARECNGDIELVSILINSELDKIADWLAVNKVCLNVQKKN